MAPDQNSTRAARPALLAFGEILWDVLPDGEVIGGAPFNVAAHAARCGLRAGLYSRVGQDERGRKARAALARFGVDDRWVQTDAQRPTGWVEVCLDQDGQPEYRITRDVAWDAIEASGAQGWGGWKFSALVCGTLAQRSPISRAALAQVRRQLPDVPVFYDINLRGTETPWELVRATLPHTSIVKLNEHEAHALEVALGGKAAGTAELFQRLSGEFGVQILLQTEGAAGCRVFSAQGSFHVPGSPVKVVSAVGAGDAFSAAFLATWLRGAPLERAAALANQLGAHVASQRETVPDYPAALLEQLRA